MVDVDTSSKVSQISCVKVCNKGFSILEELFTEKNWKLVKNELNHIVYKKNDLGYNHIEMKIELNKIYVVVPLDSKYQYETSFDSYFLACEYIEFHLNL